MSNPNDLDAIAGNALREIEHAVQVRIALEQRSRRRSPYWKYAAVTLLFGLLIAAFSGSQAKRFWFGVSEQKQIAEMTAALTASRVAVDSSHTTTGEWPRQVPLPALAALVELQSPGPDYRLLARAGRWVLTMNPAGDLQRTQH